eukprot:928077-Pleurochrysis_carterae.AAC.4
MRGPSLRIGASRFVVMSMSKTRPKLPKQTASTKAKQSTRSRTGFRYNIRSPSVPRADQSHPTMTYLKQHETKLHKAW